MEPSLRRDHEQPETDAGQGEQSVGHDSAAARIAALWARFVAW